MWDVRRWDGWRWYEADPSWDPDRARTARVWETAGTVLATAFSEYPGDVHLQVDPIQRELESEMLAWAEATLSALDHGGPRLATEVREYDVARQALVERRGWRRTESWTATHRQWLGTAPLEARPLPGGYALRSLHTDDPDDHARLADLLNASFARSGHVAAESLTFARNAPGFRGDLHLFAEARDGSFAAHAGLTYEPQSRLVVVEPVMTHPEHRGRGLARALVVAGLERARTLGAREACVDTGSDEAANRLYASCGFAERYVARRWEWRR